MNVNEMTKYRQAPRENSSVRAEVLECLVDGLQFLKNDAALATHPAQQLATRLLANIIIEQLDIGGFTIQRKRHPQPDPSEAERDGRLFCNNSIMVGKREVT